MKTISNILTTTIVALFLLSFGMKSEAVGQPCTQKKDTLTIFGCEYEIELCIECTYAYPGRIKLQNIKSLDDSCVTSPLLTPDQLIDQVISQISNWATVYFETCILSGPPCDINNPEIVTYRYPRCWYMLKDATENQTWYIPCNTQYCDVEYEYCVEMPGMNVRLTQISYNTIGGSPLECSLEGFQVPRPTQPLESSECFILHTLCDE